MVYPTLAMGYLAIGEEARADALISAATIAAAEADGETAYRLATYHAVRGEREPALGWLRRSIYLGNENHPWFVRNPAWRRLADDADLRSVLATLGRRHRETARAWRRLLGPRRPALLAS
jgi:eukaryotic-like serine/threonine-protein kinase